NFSSRTSARAAPSWAIGAHARVNAARRAGQAPHGRGSAQRGHVSGPSHGSSARQPAQRSRPARPSGARHARHAGGTRSESRRSSTPDTLPAELILTMHMVQHLLLLDLAPVLCLLGLTRVLLRPVTRRVQPVERRAGPLAHPVFAAVFYVATMWAWHVPALYDAALQHAGIHVLEHFCFATAGGLYWWHLLGPIRSPFRLSGLAPIGYMVATKILVGLLGI